MEIFVIPIEFEWEAASPTRLEGMETLDFAALRTLVSPSLRPALRGWKHVLAVYFYEE